MPKTRKSAVADEPPKSPVVAVRDAADALYRAATECCHQHDRVARVLAKSALEEEVRTAQQVCEACDAALRVIHATYETTAAAVHPTGDDEAWWHKANGLWHATSEYLRRREGCDTSSRELKDHGPSRLNGLHAEYELEASALLALRHAADAYRRERPAAA